MPLPDCVASRPATSAGTVSDLLHRAARSLEAGSSSPRLDAELLLGQILGLPRPGLIARGNETVSPARADAFAGLVERRRQGEPVAYMTGTREFWSLTLAVTPDVLVPRPETELLVELALQCIARNQPTTLLDLGTGSGAIALAVASERPRSEIVAVELSGAALAIAMQNSRTLGVANVDWRLGSWFAPVRGERFDLIVANPPYVAAGDPALPGLAAEPAMALCPGPTGLEALATIAAGAAAHLRQRGRLMLEHGQTQAPAVARLLRHSGFTDIRSHLDLSGSQRVTTGTLQSPHQETT